MRDKIFEYVEPKDTTTWEPEIIRVTGDEILNQYYPYWSDKMDLKYGIGRDRSKDIERCIEDFCVVNWATEVKNETN